MRSVGVQGDSRTYRPVLAISDFPETEEDVARLTNREQGINRVVVTVWTSAPMAALEGMRATLTPHRLDRLRHADAVVRRISHESGLDHNLWQFPVVLIPFGT